MKKHKITTARNLLSVILAVVMLFMYVPLEIIATEVQSEDDICTSEIGAVVEEPDLYEVTERREENVKHFRMPDGTFRAVTYANPVHRMDDSGEWQDIDNRLTLTTTSKGKAIRGTSDGRIQFADSSSDFSNGIFTLSENGYSVSLAAISAVSGGHEAMSAGAITSISTPVTLQAFSQSVSASVQNHAVRTEPSKELSLDERFNALSQIDNTSSIIYENAYTDTDLEYILSSNSIKENIIVNTPRNSYSYGFRLSLTGLVAALNPDGSITLNDAITSELVYTMPAPYMYDSDGETSYDVSYTLSAESDGVYTLTVTADKTWINDDSRAFPVVIDPAVFTTAAVSDTYISSEYPSSVFGSGDTMKVSDNEIAIIRTGMPTLPTGSIITKGELQIFYYSEYSSGSFGITAHRYMNQWAELLYTWNDAYQYSSTNLGVDPAWAGSAVLSSTIDVYGVDEYVATPITADAPAIAYIDVTDLVMSWYNGTPNNGVALKRMGNPMYNDSLTIYTCRAYYTFIDRKTEKEVRSIHYEPNFLISYTQPLTSGTYYIYNSFSKKYMQVEYDDGYGIGQHTFTGDMSQEWVLEDQGDGYYKIKTPYHAGGYLYLVAPTSGADGDFSIQISSMYNEDYLKYKFTHVGYGRYKIQVKAYENTSYVLATSSASADFSGYPLSLEPYTDNSTYNDLWELFLHKDYANTYIGHYQGDYRMTSVLTSVKNAFETNTDLTGYNTRYAAKEEVLMQMSSSKIFSCITHGLFDRIYIKYNDADGLLVEEESITVNDINALADNSLSNLDLVVYGACYTASTPPAGLENLVQATKAKGAKIVIAFTTSINRWESAVWMEEFMTSITLGKTINEALADADEAVIEYMLTLEDNANATIDELRPSTANRYEIDPEDGNVVLCPQS